MEIKRIFVFDQSVLREIEEEKMEASTSYYNYFLWVAELVRLHGETFWKMTGNNTGFFTAFGRGSHEVLRFLKEYEYVDILLKYRTVDIHDEKSGPGLWRYNSDIYHNFTESDLTEFIDYDEFYNKMVASDRPGGYDYSWIKGLQRRFTPDEPAKRVLSR